MTLKKAFLSEIICKEDEIFGKIMSVLESGSGMLATYINQYCFNIAWQSNDYRDVLKNFDYYLDGIGVYSALKLNGMKPERFNATDLNSKVLKAAAELNVPVYFIGGNFDVEMIKKESEDRKLNLCGYKNGYDELGQIEATVEDIENSGAKIILVGMGVPKQEVFASEIFKRKRDLVILCVGNFLEFYFGTVKRAPKILHNSGLEWFYRLLTEPKRLWRRYILGIPLFLIRIIKIKFIS